MAAHRLGIDTGGTFTDLVLMDEASGAIRLVKLASTPDDPSRAILQAIDRGLQESGNAATETKYLVHGTTVATNTIIEGKGAKTALLTTQGFRDVLEIARQIRPKLYDLFFEKPTPLVPRRHCYEIPERLTHSGDVMRALDEVAVHELTQHLSSAGIEAVAVCLLHSYENPAHEQRVGEILQNTLPHLPVSISSSLCPEMREYFRASTTVINALLMPVVSRYLARLEEQLAERQVQPSLRLMTSAGGTISSQIAGHQPVQLIESGPAAGVMAATFLSQLIGVENLISFDMGGTTAKVGLVEQGEPKTSPHFEVGVAAVAEDRAAGYPVRTPVVDLVEIGAGGGSIARVDPGGALRVGPSSGGADPGPACYGKGQPEPTVTDANLVLGRINPDYFIGGEQALDPQLAERAIRRIALQLDIDLVAAASGIVEIANANMLAALRLISVQRGFDPRDFVLVAFGGAGPLHANALAHELGLPRVVVPMSPGVTSALGLLVSDVRHDYVQSAVQTTANIDWQRLNSTFAQLETKARASLSGEGIAEHDQTFDRFLDMRYVGQSYELRVAVDSGPLDKTMLETLNKRFFAAHEMAYGYATTDAATEIVNVRVVAIGAIPRPKLQTFEKGDSDGRGAIKGRRDVYFSEHGTYQPCDIYDRYRLLSGDCVTGPAVIEEIDSTVVVHPGYAADVDQFGNLSIHSSTNP